MRQQTTVLLETCMFGNNPSNVTFETVTCSELLAFPNTSYNCYSNCEYGDQASWCATLSLRSCYTNDAVCCQSCPERALNIPNCEYGDKASWCATLSLRSCYTNDAVCCQSCPERALNIP
ncbi:hypothetical protein MAR_023634, partial [Mya arenaria]